MKKLFTSAFLICVSMNIAFSQAKKATPAKPAAKPVAAVKPAAAVGVKMASELDSVAYGIGVNLGRNILAQNLDKMNVDYLVQGMKDVLKGGNLKINDNECNMLISQYFQKQQATQRAEDAKKYESNKLAGAKFLEENKKKEGVVTLPSGLQYQIMKEGTGPKPTINDKVKTHYHGTLMDGTVFDSSVQRNSPAEFPVGGVIQGWVEALQLMPVGSKWKLFVPYNLAYGEGGMGGSIKPYTMLIFEVELLDIVK